MLAFDDKTGKKFGMLTAIKYLGDSKWLCLCDCGKETVVLSKSLNSGATRSCGCLRHRPQGRKDYAGKKFGRLTALEYIKGGKWRCVCDCGNECVVVTESLTNGNTRSCGCLQRDRTSEASRTHGMSKTRLYHVYASMKERCYNPNHVKYEYYGGRGITICDEWLRDYQVFMEWAIANGYDENAKRGECTIDRIDVNGNYEPSNCRWISQSEQLKNTRPPSKKRNPKDKKLRPVDLIDDDGNVIESFMCIRDASEATGCPESSITSVCRGVYKTSLGKRFRYTDKRVGMSSTSMASGRSTRKRS